MITRFTVRLDEGLLGTELLVTAVVFSLFTVVMGLTADGVAWALGYCGAGGAGAAAALRVTRTDWRRQWPALAGIALFNVILLFVYGRLSGGI
ncbi:hypothetical protein [Nocardia sp. NPDC024068]|uniref:hypothetical protein n=1 Tax=Nocardia sp. NPDC024068 TaxID=3157197 RepID=UPI0033C88E62